MYVIESVVPAMLHVPSNVQLSKVTFAIVSCTFRNCFKIFEDLLFMKHD